MKHVAVPIALFAAWPLALPAQTVDARAIMERARDAPGKLSNYELEFSISFETVNPDFEHRTTSRYRVTAGSGGRFRIEQRGAAQFLKVSDGTSTWTYNGHMKQYTKSGPEPMVAALTSSPANLLVGIVPGPKPNSARLVREDELRVNGTPRPCFVIEMEDDSGAPHPANIDSHPSQAWIDKETALVLKRSARHRMAKTPSGGPGEMRLALAVESMKLNQTHPDSLFTFTPPEGARLVASFDYPGMKKSELVGKPAPDFTLRDIDGKEVRLSTLRGKVVVLNFWTTWCAPCRAEIPALTKIHDEEKDIALYAVNVKEDSGVVRKYIQDNKIRYTILLAGQDRMPGDYEAHAFPTLVVVDGSGVVRTHKVGYGLEAEAQMRAAIREARTSAPPAAKPSDSPVYKVGSGVSAPRVISRRDPEYTEEARNAGISGTVVLDAVISPEGVPAGVTVIRGLGAGLDEQAVAAVNAWRFQPGLKEGKPVAVKAVIEVNFRMLESPKPSIPVAEPTTAEEAYRIGVRLGRERRPQEAMAMLSKAIAIDSKWAPGWVARAGIAFRERRYSEAIRDLDEAIRLDAGKADWYNTRGLSYSYSGQHARALEDYSRAIELQPSGPASFYNNRGWALNETGQHEKAVEALNRALAIEPAYQIAYENRALAHFRLKAYDRAIADYTAAIQLNPTRWQYERRAEAKRASGDTAGAEEDSRKAAEFAQPSQPAVR